MTLVRILLMVLILLPACGGSDEDVLTIGCKNFTEQYVLLHLLELRLEACGLEVETEELAGTMICQKALLGGQIDGYVEYSGTALMAIFNRGASSDPSRVLTEVRDAYAELGIRAFAPLGFANSYGIAVRESDAKKNGWTRVSDLAGDAAGLTAGFTSEFQERPDGYPRLRELYGFAFGETTDLDPGTMYDALANAHVDVICAFTTDARLAKYDLVILEDDRHLWPPYDAIPVFREDALEKHAGIAAALEPLLGTLDAETMIRLNHAVDVEKMDPESVSRAYLEERGLLDG